MCLKSVWTETRTGFSGLGAKNLKPPVRLDKISCPDTVETHGKRSQWNRRLFHVRAGITVAPLLRVKVKITVKFPVSCRPKTPTYSVFVCEFAFGSQEWSCSNNRMLVRRSGSRRLGSSRTLRTQPLSGCEPTTLPLLSSSA